MTSRQTAKYLAQSASDKKAEDILVLDMRKIVNYCDFLVICSGNSDTQARAIAGYIKDKLDEIGVSRYAREGALKADWVVVDAGDVIVHVFQKRVREFYQLEYLWQDAPQVKWQA